MKKNIVITTAFVLLLCSHSVASAATIVVDPLTGYSNSDFLYEGSLDIYQITVSADSVMTMVGLYDTHAPFDMEFNLMLDGIDAGWTRHHTGTENPQYHFMGERDDLFLSTGTHFISFEGSTVYYNLVGISLSSVHDAASVPEPGTLLLLGSGLAGLMAARKRLN